MNQPRFCFFHLNLVNRNLLIDLIALKFFSLNCLTSTARSNTFIIRLLSLEMVVTPYHYDFLNSLVPHYRISYSGNQTLHASNGDD